MQERVFLGRYESVRQLGEGGMGCVYLARDLQGRRPVVVKVMHSHIAANPQFRERFQRETALMARLRHPNAVAFLDAAVDESRGPFIVMEFVNGTPLDKVLARHGPFHPPRLHRLVKQLCDVLAAAHAEHIVHCDLKPANLVIVEFDSPFEQLKVMDFGLARLSEGAEPASGQQGEGIDSAYAVGTPGYMPPEQVRGEKVDHRGDLYSIGVILYRLLTGRLPFEGASTMEILMAQAAGNPPTFAELDAGSIPFGVEVVVRSCLAPRPADRPASADELGRAYQDAVLRGYGTPEEADIPPAPKPAAAPAARPRSLPANPDAIVEQLEAWLPEQIAICKLQGFADATGGQLVTSLPGLIRFAFRDTQVVARPPGLFSWLGVGRKEEVVVSASGIDMELHLKQTDPGRRSLLQITVLLRPAGMIPPGYHSRCGDLVRTLRSFLMCKE